METIDCSVIVPVYNSEKTLRELFERIKATFEGVGNSFEVVFVEDCSADNSWPVLCALKREFPETITAVRLGRNFGQHNAILCGLHYVRGRLVITIDDDLQNPPEEIAKLLDAQARESSDLVYGTYKEKKHDRMRNLGSGLVQRILRYVFQTQGSITSFRLMTRDLADKLQFHKQSFVFIDGLLHWYTRYIKYVEVRHEPRQYGKSGYSPMTLLKLASNLLFNFTTIPLRVITSVGLLFSTLSFLVGLVFVIRKLLYDVPLGYTSIIVSVFFIGSVTLLVIGLIGEYLSRLYSLQNDKPQYSVKEVVQ